MFHAVLLLSSIIPGELPRDWAFKPVPTTAIPRVDSRTPIDAFVLKKLDEHGLAFSPEASRATLIRRLTFDLIGLPPTPPEIDAFVSDQRPDAYELLVNRLLASPHYGERQALWWLDLVRYAESDGFKSDDPRPNAWRYRDYVIRSFNGDKPYDRFIREQLAGDEIAPNDPDALIATGFLRHYPDEYNAVNVEQRRYEILTDITDTTAATFLGLTLGCARCHDHKFDPIKQTDYFRMQAFFAAWWPVEMPLSSPEARRAADDKRRAWEAKTAEVRARIAELEKPLLVAAEKKERQRFPKEYSDLIDIPVEQRDAKQKQIALMVEKQVYSRNRDVSKSMKPPLKEQWDAMMKRMAAFDRDRPPSLPSAMTCTDVSATAPPTHLLKRGDWRKAEEVIAPGYLSAIDDREAQVSATSHSTGRRTALANWIASPNNSLTARVLVNRLWQSHFGRGLVASPSDFGAQGEKPTHPELLDWLANDFIANGWSLKHIHQRIVMSAAYRQTSVTSLTPPVDVENKLLWRQNRRRLEGEALRDALLSVAGHLSQHAGGPSVFPELPDEMKGKWKPSATAEERHRRSVYVAVRRNLRYPLIAAFDAPDANETCGRRFVTTTAPQALMLLNDKHVRGIATAFADRAVDAETAFRLALGRSPDEVERSAIQRFAATHGLAEACHALMNLNEFVFID